MLLLCATVSHSCDSTLGIILDQQASVIMLQNAIYLLAAHPVPLLLSFHPSDNNSLRTLEKTNTSRPRLFLLLLLFYSCHSSLLFFASCFIHQTFRETKESVEHTASIQTHCCDYQSQSHIDKLLLYYQSAAPFQGVSHIHKNRLLLPISTILTDRAQTGSIRTHPNQSHHAFHHSTSSLRAHPSFLQPPSTRR